MKTEPAVIVKNLYKSFKLPHEQHNGIKQLIVNIAKRKKGYEKQEVLNDISFEIKKGEFYGIVGRNGSGKSTLLKLLAGIYAPDSGLVRVNGSLTPFIELGVGFNPELTGRENVYMNGALLGFSHNQMDRMYSGIVEFAELERFMDQKLKNYSSGMQVRLAFSIAIRADSDILLIDEVLAVGDAAFQQKCYDYFDKLKKAKRTVIIVTHDMSAVRRFCSKALLIEDGRIKAIGSPSNVASQYTLDNVNAEKDSQQTDNSFGPHIKTLEIERVSPRSVNQEDDFVFDILYEINKNIAIDIGISVIYQNLSVIEHNTKDVPVAHEPNQKHRLRYRLPLHSFNPGRFEITVAMFEKTNFELMGFNTDTCSFVVQGEKKGGLLKEKGVWEKRR